MVSGRPDEREGAGLRRLDRDPRRELRGLPARLGDDRVRIVEPGRLVDLCERVEVLRRVDTFDRGARCRPSLACVGERVEQDADPLRCLGMTKGRVQARERRMGQDVDSGTG
jgi:hypothetical protein